MKTETRIIVGIIIATLFIIIGGMFLFNKTMGTNTNTGGDYSKYITTNLNLDTNKTSRDFNPKITGSATTTTSTTTIHITEFLDYECPACATNGEALNKALIEKYGANIIITRKIFPVHGQPSIDIGSIVLASQIFGKDIYENVHRKVFETQNEWIRLPKKEREGYFKNIIIGLGIDYDKLLAESKDKKYTEQILTDKQDAIDLGIKATPSFIIENHTIITGGLPINEIVKNIDIR